MRIDSNGDVGIGTTDPTEKLDVVGVYIQAADTRANNTNKIFGLRVPHYANATNPINLIGAVAFTGANPIYIGGNDTSFAGTAATSIQFYTAANNTTASGTERMRITSTGDVGIGVTSTSARLDVHGTTATFRLQSTTGTNASYLWTTNTGGDFYFGRDNSTGTTFGTNSAYSAVLYSANAYPMAFFTNATERMRIDSSGNVGLSTVNVNSNFGKGNGYSGNTTATASGYLDPYNGSTGNTSLYNTGAFAILFGTNNTERMRIDSSGNLAINGGSILTQSTAQQLSIFASPTAVNNTTRIELYGTTHPTLANQLILRSNTTIFTDDDALSERMRIDSSGMLGLGITPAQTSGIAMEFGGSANNNAINFLNSGNCQGWITSNAYYNGTNWLRKYASGTTCTAYTANDQGSHVWRYAAASTAGSTISWSEAMRIDTSGNVGIGVTPSAWRTINKALQVGTNTCIANIDATTNSGMDFGTNFYADSGGSFRYIINSYSSRYRQQVGTHSFSSAGSGTAGGAITYTSLLEFGIGTTVALQGATSQSGTGITFPATQSASSNANTLDDYEEGTWTPVDGSGAGISFTNATGKYTKIGRMVIAQASVDYPSTASGSSAIISGLPFSTTTDAGGFCMYSTTTFGFVMRNQSNSTNILITNVTNPSLAITNSQFSTASIQFTFIYQI
jgi:hypothetical protein